MVSAGQACGRCFIHQTSEKRLARCGMALLIAALLAFPGYGSVRSVRFWIRCWHWGSADVWDGCKYAAFSYSLLRNIMEDNQNYSALIMLQMDLLRQ
jgi:hypothetical protein